MTTPDAGLKVLVVEDERIISLALCALLRGLGHQVLGCVPSGEQALELVERQRPDLVFMDIHLEGGLDGIATARMLRERQGPPVAFTSAYTDAATRTRAQEVAPLAFLSKPVARQDIMRLMTTLAQQPGA
ncbi:Response regulator receiver domain-containing protein [Humidesulfovibrio mexicanus]|uniref:Response regulator receiver domain-containing protein n=1 Tax=Humidesulfovibrio mexicanus TaxID=147047 RepID=A0A239C6V7_9BACT|nr:response regulator [Humidesulfovibrio mexicanus]SNS15408.1 Response regulator receiver domain-containing protein [Humidesulfovibrio mexicanus]